MPSTDYSANFLAVAAENSKQLIVVVEITGSPVVLTSGTIYSRVTYGSGVTYGQAGLVYGGLIESTTPFSPLLSLDKSSLTLQQKIEPIQGRSSVSLMTLAFIDKNQFMTQLISPGVLIPDILGAEVVVRLGFPQISYPQDYAVISRGRISQATSQSGLVTLQLSDPSIVRRQQIFYMAQTYLPYAISSTSVLVPVASTAGFNQQILSPGSTVLDPVYDSAIKTYITIDDEVIEYGPLSIGSGPYGPGFEPVTRGARGTTPAVHDAGSTVTAVIEVQDNAIAMALKLMLSGWNGPYLSGLAISSFVSTFDSTIGNQQSGFLINADAVNDYGAAPGDWVTISGATNSANNGTFQIILFLDSNLGSNTVIVTNATFFPETGTSAQFSIRSQYDSYPVNLGVQMPGYEVDIARHQFIQNTFMGANDYSLSFFKTAAESSAKTFIESQIFLPFGCYSLTRRGQCSMQLTHPPIGSEASDSVVLNETNVLNPQNLNPTRGLNNRYFYNEIDLTYDYDDSGSPQTESIFVDTNSLNIIGISSVLPIQSEGLKSSLTNINIINGVYNYVLSRYKNGAILINVEVNFGSGILIDAGDVIEIDDDGFLQISNFLTGQRNLGAQLFEVVDRTINLVTGKVTLQVVAGVGAGFQDRFAVISPSSFIAQVPQTNVIVLGDGFGTATPGFEIQKWRDYLGQGLIGLIHNINYSYAATCVIGTQNLTIPNGRYEIIQNAINISGITLSPTATLPLILEVASYSASTAQSYQEPFKTNFAFIDPSVTVISGVSPSAFTVAASSINTFQVGLPVLIHSVDYSSISTECIVSGVNTGTNTVAVSGIGFTFSTSAATGGGPFTPSAGNIAELIGFPDLGQPYRII